MKSDKNENIAFSGYKGNAIYRWNIPKNKHGLEAKVINAVRLYFALERYDLITKKIVECWHKFFTLKAARPYVTALSVAYPEVRECVAGVEKLKNVLSDRISKPFLAQFLDALRGSYGFRHDTDKLSAAARKFSSFVDELERIETVSTK